MTHLYFFHMNGEMAPQRAAITTLCVPPTNSTTTLWTVTHALKHEITPPITCNRYPTFEVFAELVLVDGWRGKKEYQQWETTELEKWANKRTKDGSKL